MGTFLYFAYGSNMLTERLQAPNRCPSAVPLGQVVAPGYRLCFSKRSKKDSSGKATLMKSEEGLDKVYGVVFKILENELGALDKAEGRGNGYERDDNFRVIHGSNKIAVRTYLASQSAVDKTLKPYDWYHALVVAGALQHDLPKPYIELLCAMDVTVDPHLDREERREALRVLKCAGFESLFKKCSK